MALLELDLERASYGPAAVLGRIELAVDDGELMALLGGNGAGKTTLLRTISGVLVHAVGRVRLDGADITRLPAHRRARAGIVHVPEGRRVFRGLTVRENLAMGAYGARRRGSAGGAALERVYDLFPILAERASQQATSLSGGQQQMLALGRGLMAEPRLLMVDEASLGLSPRLTQEVLDALARIRAQGTAVLMVEQNARGALSVADRACVLERGQVALAGQADELLADQRVASLYLGGHT